MPDSSAPIKAWLMRRIRGESVADTADLARLSGHTEPADSTSARDAPTDSRRVSTLLDQIQASALAVYARHGLPARTGHYFRSAPDFAWRFIGENLSPEERWALVPSASQSPGPQFASIETLGRLVGDDAELLAASDILARCARLRRLIQSSAYADLAEDIEAAISLGADWRRIELAAPPPSPPQFSSPEPSPVKKVRAARTGASRASRSADPDRKTRSRK